MSGITTLIFVGAVMFAVLGGVTLLSHIYNLNIKEKPSATVNMELLGGLPKQK